MSINLGCRDAFVPQHLLYSTDISSAIKEFSGEAVPQCMRRKFMRKPGSGAPFYNYIIPTTD
jgi:hypothetical protein